MKLYEAIGQARQRSGEKPAETQEKPANPHWLRAIANLNTYPRDFSALVLAKENQPFLRKTKLNKHVRISLSRGMLNNFEVELVVYEPYGEGAARAFYTMFNNSANISYQVWLTD